MGVNCRREHDAILWVTLRSALLAVPDLLKPIDLDVIGAQNNGLKTVSTKGCGRGVIIRTRDGHREVLAVWTAVRRRGLNANSEGTLVVKERPLFAHLVCIRR